MKTTDYIRTSIEASKMFTLSQLDDMKDAPLTQPTSKGGNHPLWILGHLTYSESNIISHIIQGNENPLIGWKEMFGTGGEPTTDAVKYLPWDEVRTEFDEVREKTMSFLDGLTDADLENPSKNCPPGREQMMGTIGSCFVIVALHPTMHYGQVADARRMAGRDRLFG
jgi:hypothetical protein